MSKTLADLDDLLSELDQIDDKGAQPQRASAQVSVDVSSRGSVAPTQRQSTLPEQNSQPRQSYGGFEQSTQPRQSYGGYDQSADSRQSVSAPRLSVAPDNSRQPPVSDYRQSVSNTPVDVRQTRRTSVMSPKPASSSDSCASCGKPITGQHILALNKLWHVEHFTCHLCGNKLQTEFFEHEGQCACKHCIDNIYICSRCNQPINGEYYVGSGSMLHPHCVQRNNCGDCGGQITGTEMTALNRTYHPECFKCKGCGVKLEGTFYAKDNFPHCYNCVSRGANNVVGGASIACVTCGGTVTGTYVSFEGKNFHSNCFSCSRCSSIMSPDAFYSLSGQFICENCAKNV